MNDLHKQVSRARRRLTAQRFVGALTWAWFAALCVAAVLVGVDARWAPWGAFHAEYANGWFFAGGALIAGLLGAIVYTWITRARTLEAAIELDKRFALKERVSSALTLEATDRETAAGQALVADALRRVGKLEVSDKFKLEWKPVSLLPVVPALLALGLAFVPPLGVEDATANVPDPLAAAASKKEVRKLVRTIAENKKKLEEKGVKEPYEWLGKLEKELPKMEEKKDLSRKEALKNLNEMAEQLKQRQDTLGSDEKLKEQLQKRLQDMEKGPADKLADALSKGEFQKAAKELDKLKQQLKDNKLDDKQKEALAKQMGQMQDKLQKMADAHQQMQQNLQKQLDEARKSGQTDQAEKLQQQLKQASQQSQQMQKMQDLAQKLGQCQQCMKEGKSSEAAEHIQDLQQQLDQLAQSQAEMEALQDALDQLAQCKNGMCQGQGNGNGKKGGDGMGKAQGGEGDRAEQEEATSTYDTRVKPKMDKGAAVVTGEIGGANNKGNYSKQILEQIQAAKSSDSDPLTDQRMSRQYKDHARDYLNKIRQQ